LPPSNIFQNQNIVYTQGTPGGMCQTSRGCSLCSSIPIQPKKLMSKVERLQR